MPKPDFCSIWQWLSMPPGRTNLPPASISRVARALDARLDGGDAAVLDADVSFGLAILGDDLGVANDQIVVGHRPTPPPACAAAPGRRKPPLEPRHHGLELGAIRRRQRRARRTLPRTLDRAALEQHFLAQRQPDRRLHLVPHQRQVDVEQILGLLRLAGREQLVDLRPASRARRSRSWRRRRRGAAPAAGRGRHCRPGSRRAGGRASSRPRARA